MAFSAKRVLTGEYVASNSGDPKRRRIVDGVIQALPSDPAPLNNARVPPNFAELRAGGGGGSAGGGGGPVAMDTMFMPASIQNEISKRGQVYSIGRGSPNTKQSRVVETVHAPPQLFETLKMTPENRQIAPLGSKAALSIATGAVCYGVQNETDANHVAQKSFQGFGEVAVRDCVNGLDADAILYFKGFSNTDIDYTVTNMDPAMSVTTAGGDTIVVTGPMHIKAGQRVGFLATPWVVMDDNGTIKPGIRQKGIPDDKFRPMIIPLDDLASEEAPTRAVDIAAEIWRKNGNRGPQNTAEFQEWWQEGRHMLRKVVLNIGLETKQRVFKDDTMPLDLYLGWLIAGTEGGCLQLVENKQLEIAAAQFTSPLMPQRDVVDMHNPGFNEMTTHIDRRKAQCLVNHRQWVDRHSIGKAMSSAGPGGALDILAGYY